MVTLQKETNQIIPFMKWLLPSSLELVYYLAIAVATLFISNIDFVETLLLLPHDFSIHQAILGSIDNLLSQILGTKAPAALVTGVFWGFVGILVYIMIWLGANFSTEVSNDLAVRNYVNPAGTDPTRPLKEFIEHTIFRVICILLLIFYVNTIVQVLLPLWTAAYTDVVELWPDWEYIRSAAITLATEVLFLHGLTVLTRLILMRKRIFGGY